MKRIYESQSNDKASPAIYECSSHILWAVEIRGIILIDKKRGIHQSIGYPRAAIWDLISRGYSWDQIRRMLSVISSMKKKEAEHFLIKTLDVWTKAGFLIKRN